MRKFGAGIIAFIIKVGPKIIAVLAKVVKGLKVGKIGLAATSMASYAYLLSWQFAVMIMVMLFIHESGHIWAMRRYGIKTQNTIIVFFILRNCTGDDNCRCQNNRSNNNRHPNILILYLLPFIRWVNISKNS